jgi:hypothetical protein
LWNGDEHSDVRSFYLEANAFWILIEILFSWGLYSQLKLSCKEFLETCQLTGWLLLLQCQILLEAYVWQVENV